MPLNVHESVHQLSPQGTVGVENSLTPVSLENPLVSALVTRLSSILSDVDAYKRLLHVQPTDAQTLLDNFRKLIDLPGLTPRLRGSFLVAIQRISYKTELYPTCYQLEDVVLEGEEPKYSGGFADVFKGKYQGQYVSLKLLRLYADRLDQILKVIVKEALIWGQLSHPNILPFYGVFRFRNQICMVSPWMDNGHIGQYLTDQPEAPRLRLATDVANGLSYLHGLGIIHGDLKGENVLVDPTGRARLADFGISSASHSQIVAWSSQTKGASKGGSVRYQAPELFDVERENDNKVENTKDTDVYAWGCVCLEIFTSKVPFAEIRSSQTISFKIMKGGRPARPLPSSQPWTDWGLTEDIWSCIENCWDQDPTRRPPVTEVVRRLDLLLSPEDPRQISEDRREFPGQLRQRMSEGLKLIDVETLDNMLRNTIEVEVTAEESELITRDVIESKRTSGIPPNLGGALVPYNNTAEKSSRKVNHETNVSPIRKWITQVASFFKAWNI